MRVAALVLLCLLAAACGGAKHAATTTRAKTVPARTVPGGPRVAVLGPLRLKGVTPTALDDAELVVVDEPRRDVAALADAHPDAHFVLVGRSHATADASNVGGLLFREDEVAYLAGVVAGLVTSDEGALDATVAWVGGRRVAIADAFAAGARAVHPGVRVLDAWSEPDAARCKEAALDAISRGASVVLAGTGRCAEGALAGAADQNAVGLSLATFERPEVAVAQTIRDAAHGVYHGGEDVVFGAASGAVAVGKLDPRVSPETATRAREIAQELASGLRSPR